jgi:cysteine synthase A
MNVTSQKLNNLKRFIGNTPLVQLECSIENNKVNILAKYEAWNFTGSIKDRMAFEILNSAYQTGNLNENDIIVEATSGNTGIAFAAMGAFLGHRVQIYMPDWLSAERKRILKFYGAELFEISAENGGFLKCIELVDKKSKKSGFFGPKQFDNSWNVMAHYKTTAPEIENTLKNNNLGNLDIFVAGAGTGGTIMGVNHYFSSKNTNFRAYPILPSSNEDGKHRIEGIGDSFIPNILDLQSLSPVMRVEDSDAINIARKINKLGLSVGISSGANVYGALVRSLAEEYPVNIATILCDDNKKYLTTDLCTDSQEEASYHIEIENFKIIS